MGFSVTAIDNNAETLRSYYADYAWPRDPEIIVGTDLRAVKGRKFALITAFDVFEHLCEPEVMLAQMRELMADGALIFCTVPNRRSIFEIAWRVNWKMGLAMGRTFTPGEPHIQFKSPREWRSFFENCGFRILDHEMAIGFFVNTWAALVDVPAGVLRKLRRAIGLGADSAVVSSQAFGVGQGSYCRNRRAAGMSTRAREVANAARNNVRSRVRLPRRWSEE